MNGGDTLSRIKSTKINHLIFTFLIMLLISYVAIISANTYAWFTDESEISTEKIKSATYSVDVSVKRDSQEIEKTENAYQLEGGMNYQLVLTANGSASTGYCIIKFTSLDEEISYLTHPIPTNINNQFLVILQVEKDVSLTIEYAWGTNDSTAEKISNGDTLIYN